MERIEGYIDLDTALNLEISRDESQFLDTNFINRLKSIESVEILDYLEGKKLVFSFEYEGERYFFKYDSMVEEYNELFAYEFCNFLKIPCVEYDLARIGPYSGVISKDYKKKNAKYISGLDILMESFPDFLKEEDLEHIDKTERLYEKYRKYGILNNLDDIRIALKIRYRDREDMQEIVKRLMRKLIDMFLIDILLVQADRNTSNWEVIEYENGYVDLQPQYDNGRIMLDPAEFSKLAMTISRRKSLFDCINSALELNVIDFQKRYPFESINHIKAWVNALKKENITLLLKNIEKKTGYEIPRDKKMSIMVNCIYNLKFFRELLNIKIDEKLEFIDIEEFLSDSLIELKAFWHREAHSVITPKQCLCAVYNDDRLTSSIVYKKIYENIFPPIDIEKYEKIDSSVIRVDYFISEYFVEVKLFIPGFVTKYQISELYRIGSLVSRARKNYTLNTTVTNYNPMTGRKDYKEPKQKIFSGADGLNNAIKFLESMGRIVDYELPFEEKLLIDMKDKSYTVK